MPGYVSVSFTSLPVIIRLAITKQIDPDEFDSLINQPKYSFGARKAARYYFYAYKNRAETGEAKMQGN